MKQVIIMRGVSGAGKSTVALKLAEDAVSRQETAQICSADYFFLDINDAYQFDGSKLGDAHKDCLSDFLIAVEDDVDLVIVDNTNINVEDMAPYVALGELYGYEVEILQVDTPASVAMKRNVHGVPDKSVLRMENLLSTVKVPSRYKVVHMTNEEES
jgi:predicted kinase